MSILSKIFGPKEYKKAELNITTDIHSHILPGLDDGAENTEESLELIRGMYDLGYRKMIGTPHIMGDFYRNNPDNIGAALNSLRRDLDKAGIDMEVYAAAEYYLDEWFEEKLERDEILSFGDRYVLVETSFMNQPANLHELFFKIKLKGYKPVLAHPERYVYLYEDFDKYDDLHEKEILLQINLNSLSGYYSPESKKAAEYLIEKGMVSLVGSDAHKPRHVQMLEKSFRTKGANMLEGQKLLNNRL